MNGTTVATRSAEWRRRERAPHDPAPRRATRRRALVTVALIAALALAGCGGDDGPSGPATTATVTAPATARVSVFMPRGDPGLDCRDVRALPRTVDAPAVLSGAMTELLAGPTAAERTAGYGGWFGARTAGMLNAVSIRDRVARIDFADFSDVIPNASSSCGGALLLAQLDRTATAFESVDRAVYSFDGDVDAFYAWLGMTSPDDG